VRLLLIGLSHATASVEVREKAAIDGASLYAALQVFAARSELNGVLVLATCSRTEVYATGLDLPTIRTAIHASLRKLHSQDYVSYASHLYEKSDSNAALHLFRVASGLDSVLIGEPQVLGQLRRAVAVARQLGSLDHVLGGTADRAVSAARRVRRRSGLAKADVSIGLVAVENIKDTLATAQGLGVLVVGAGEVGEVVARALAAAGARLSIVSRDGESARRLATQVGGQALGADHVDRILAEVDVVVSSAGASPPLFTAARLEPILAARGRQLLLFDLAVPRDVEAAVAALPKVRLINVDELSTWMVQTGPLPARQTALADKLLLGELRLWQEWQRANSWSPILATLTEYAERVRQAAVQTATRGLQDSEQLEGRLDTMSRSLVSKLLMHPLAYLRAHPEDRAAEAAVLRIFGWQAAGHRKDPRVASLNRRSTNPESRSRSSAPR